MTEKELYDIVNHAKDISCTKEEYTSWIRQWISDKIISVWCDKRFNTSVVLGFKWKYLHLQGTRLDREFGFVPSGDDMVFATAEVTESPLDKVLKDFGVTVNKYKGGFFASTSAEAEPSNSEEYFKLWSERMDNKEDDGEYDSFKSMQQFWNRQDEARVVRYFQPENQELYDQYGSPIEPEKDYFSECGLDENGFSETDTGANRVSAVAYLDVLNAWAKNASKHFAATSHHTFKKEMIHDFEKHSDQLKRIAELLKNNKV